MCKIPPFHSLPGAGGKCFGFFRLTGKYCPLITPPPLNPKNLNSMYGGVMDEFLFKKFNFP